MDVSGIFEPKLEEKKMDCSKKKEQLGVLASTYSQFAHIQNRDQSLDFAEYFFQCGVEVLEQTENNQYFSILSRSLLALVYSKKGQLSKALAVGEKALDDALSQAGEIAPICKMVLDAILMENGNFKKAGEGLMDSAVLFKEMDRQAPLVNNNQVTVGNKSLKSLKFENKPDAISQEDSGSYLFRIQMFGPFRVFHRGEEIDSTSWRTVKSRDLLAYLAHQDKPVSTDQILEDLWPDVDPGKSSALFHTTLYYLRRVLQQFTDEEIIIRGSKRYQLRQGSIITDRCQFEENVHLALAKTMNGTLANQLENALLLYQGDYLEDLDYQWVIPIQEELKNLHVEIKQKLATYYLKNRMYSRALIHLRQLMTIKPYSEEILRLLLRSFAEMGDQSEVKKQYALFTQAISEELGLQPSPEMELFYNEISKRNVEAAF